MSVLLWLWKFLASHSWITWTMRDGAKSCWLPTVKIVTLTLRSSGKKWGGMMWIWSSLMETTHQSDKHNQFGAICFQYIGYHLVTKCMFQLSRWFTLKKKKRKNFLAECSTLRLLTTILLVDIPISTGSLHKATVKKLVISKFL